MKDFLRGFWRRFILCFGERKNFVYNLFVLFLLFKSKDVFIFFEGIKEMIYISFFWLKGDRLSVGKSYYYLLEEAEFIIIFKKGKVWEI